MTLRRFESGDVALVATWLAQPENYRWLEFGNEQQPFGGAALASASRRDGHVLRLFTDDDGTPIGLVALSGVSRSFRSANLWYVLGDKRHAARGTTTRAVGALLDVAFGELGLRVVQAWAVEENVASIQVLLRNGFRHVGRWRSSHDVDGRPCDRLLFDLLAAEHRHAARDAAEENGR